MIIIREKDDLLRLYQQMVEELGEGKAATVMARAMNHEGAKTYTAVKRTLQKQTDIPRGMIIAATKFRSTSRQNLRTIISGSGKELPLRLFQPKRIKTGVSAKVWGTRQKFRSAFIVNSAGGNVFHRLTRQRLPIQRMFGPSIPKEMVKDQVLKTFEEKSAGIMDRVMHELTQILKV